ncbi:HET-domain-containing protein [Hypoxylon cercidicola]|nr:HET-domain-containing protein [Hypoxylon cercidicola]
MVSLIAIILWIGLANAAISPFLLPPRQYYAYAITLAVFIALLRDEIHAEISFGWAFAWMYFILAMKSVLHPNMHWSFYVTWTVPLACLWLLFRPRRGWAWFWALGFTATFLQWFVYMFYLFYVRGTRKASLFPFNLFSGFLRVPKERWLPSKLYNKSICDHCKRFINNSRLIMGSPLPLVLLTNSYPHYDTVENLKTSAESGRNSSSGPCPVCNLLFYSISGKNNNFTTKADDDTQLTVLQKIGGYMCACTKYLIKCSTHKSLLTVKVWEERPLTQYTYVQLHLGGKPLGARILIHRNSPSQFPCNSANEPATNSAAHLEQMKTWISACQRNHTLCEEVRNSGIPLPTRLLRIEPAPLDSCAFRLSLVETEGWERVDYVALSHCWGGKNPIKLSVSNYQSFREGIDFLRINKTMQHAIQTVNGLGYSYLWIDSLCIIQEGDNSDDFKKESIRMADVYSGAVCTIAATAARTGDDGCFRERNPSCLQPLEIGVSSASPEESGDTGHIYMRIDDVFDFERHIDNAPINTRGWVFQERVLSPRIVHFGHNMVFWECWQRSASEISPAGYVYKRYPDDFKDNYTPRVVGVYNREELEQAENENRGVRRAYEEGILNRPPPPTRDPDDPPKTGPRLDRKMQFWRDVRKRSSYPWHLDQREASGFRSAFWKLKTRSLSHERVGPLGFTHLWYEIVGIYSSTDLTHYEDKLRALGSISKEIQKIHEFTYIAGLWEETLLTDLLWFNIEGKGRRLITQDLKSDTHHKKTSDSTDAQQVGGNTPLSDPICPTWSWASIKGKVSTDLVPDNSNYNIRLSQAIADIQHVKAADGSPMPTDDELEMPKRLQLRVEAPLLDVLEIKAQKIKLQFQEGHPNRTIIWARVLWDIKPVLENENLACLPLVVLETFAIPGEDDEDEYDDEDLVLGREVQGLVLKKVGSTYERWGHFTIERKTLKRKTIEAFNHAKRSVVVIN